MCQHINFPSTDIQWNVSQKFQVFKINEHFVLKINEWKLILSKKEWSGKVENDTFE